MDNNQKSFSIIIPTMWRSDKIFKMLPIYEKSKYVKEIIIIDNEPSKKTDLSKYSKIKYYSENTNIYVNPAWNVGYTISKYELILANDDIIIQDLDKVLNLLLETNYDIVGVNLKPILDKGMEILPINEFPGNSYGCFMYIKNYRYIPEKYKIWFGDDILFSSAENPGILVNSGIETKASETLNSNNKELRNEIAKKDTELFSKENLEIKKTKLKVFAVLVNYGDEQISYLETVIKELKSFKNYEVTVQVNSNINLKINGIDKVNLFDKMENYQLLPLTCRKTIWDNRDKYDIFIFGENDHLFKEHHVDKHIEYSKILPKDRICGLIQYEENGYDLHYPAYHAHYEWDFNSVEIYDNKKFAHFTNLHQATFIITKEQLLDIGSKKDFTKFFGQSKYSDKCKVNTDIYQFAGMKKLICISEFKENIIHHLPNLYIDGLKGRNKNQSSDDNRMKYSVIKLLGGITQNLNKNKIINGFYLNLDRREDRKIKMDFELKKTKHNIVRYSAINGDSLKSLNGFNGTIKNSEKKQYATYLSHLNMLKKARDLNWEYVIILEDDLTLCNDFDYRLELFLKNLPSDWSIGYLGFNEQNNTTKEKINEYVYRLKNAVGCFGMIVNGKHLSTIIDVIEKHKFAIDEVIRRHIQEKYPCYAFIPFFMYVNDDYSDLWNQHRVLDKIKKYFRNTLNSKSILDNKNIVILSTLWNAKKFIPQFINSIKNQTYKNFIVYVVDDNSNDGSYEVLTKLTSGDNRFKIFKNSTQKFKTQNFYEIIHNQNLINNHDIIIELDGDDAFYGNNVVEKVHNHFKDPNLWIAGYRWIDNRGQKSPFKFPPNADNPRSQVWSYSAMRVFKAFLFRSINQNDLMFEGKFIRAANDVAYGMPMLEMSGKEHFRSFNDITYLYNWHDKNTHSKTSSVRDTGLQKRTEKYIYSLQRYKKLVNGNVISSKNSNIVIPKIKNIANTEKINKIKNLIPVTPQSKTVIEKVVEKQEVIKIVNLIPKITNNNNIRKITSQILSKPKEDNNNRSVVTNENRVKVTGQTQNNQTKNTPRFNFDTPIVKPQDKIEIDKKRQEFENILLYTAKGKKEIKPIPPKNIGIRI
jgi:GR25 family glycosyltransferase involved in LPS biosynthesis